MILTSDVTFCNLPFKNRKMMCKKQKETENKH